MRVSEVDSIIMQIGLQGLTAPIITTYDLMNQIITQMGGRFVASFINKYIENEFSSESIIETRPGIFMTIDTRPSDAIILSVQNHAPIYIEEDIFARWVCFG